MKKTIDVRSENRLGITHEVLKVFSVLSIDLAGVEMVTHHTYLQYVIGDEAKLEKELFDNLMKIAGVESIKTIELLPSEAERLHLDAILSHLPDPLLDIDKSGKILKANQAALEYLKLDEASLYQKTLEQLFSISLTQLIKLKNAPLEVSFDSKSFFMEASPIYEPIQRQLTGAIVTLKPSEKVGLTIASIQQGQFQAAKPVVVSNELKTTFLNAEKYAGLELPVLITGETGTGKEVIAKHIHEHSSRKDKPFLAINCAALPENLLESELFGYKAGAFSGASKNGKPGLFELADQGTVFLDEIGEMSPYLQAKLLRFLQEYSFRRLGGSRERSVNVRVISATHRALKKQIETGQFRQDLYYRLNVLSLSIPALRDRPDDIEPLAKQFASIAGIQVRQKPSQLSKAAVARLLDFDWPGNVRQLQNVIFRSVAMTNKSKIGPDDIAFNWSDPENIRKTDKFDVSNLKQALENYEASILKKLLPRYPSTRLLAKRLGVSHNAIAQKLRKYSLELGK